MKTTNQTTNSQTENSDSTEANRFKEFVKQVVSVSKDEIDKREAEYQNQRATKKMKKKTAKAA